MGPGVRGIPSTGMPTPLIVIVSNSRDQWDKAEVHVLALTVFLITIRIDLVNYKVCFTVVKFLFQ